MKKRFFLLFYLLFTCSLYLAAQDSGKPFLRNYPVKQYKQAPQNWAVVQDQRGILYFANDKGVLEFDGKNWEFIPVSNNSAVRSLSFDKQNGIVYVGASGEFGYLAPDKKGKMQYISLTNLLKESEKNFADVWSCQATPDGVFFQTNNILFRFRWETQTIRTWASYPDSQFFLCFYAQEQLYLVDLNKGLLALTKGEIRPVIDGQQFEGERIYAMLPYAGDKILLGTRTRGLYIYHTKRTKGMIFEKFETEAEEYLIKNQLYSVSVLKSGHFALCTVRGGVIILNQKGKILDKIDKEIGLQDDNVRALLHAADDILWLALDKGISQVNLDSPIRFWDESSGLKGTIKSITLHKKKIYVATTLGVYFLENNQFLPVKGIATQCWSLLNFAPAEKPQEKQLLVGTNQGIYEIKNDQAFLIIKTTAAVVSLYASLKNPSRIFVGLKGGFLSVYYQNGAWKDEGKVEKIQDEIYSIAEDQKGNFWLGTFVEGLVKVQIDENNRLLQNTRFDTLSGLPSLRDNNVYQLDGKLFFATQKGLYRFDEKQNKFLTNDLLGKQFTDGSQGIYKMVIDSQKNIWLGDFDNQKSAVGVALLQKNNAYQWYDTPLKRLPAFSETSLYADKEGFIWIGGSEGLFRFDTQKKKDYQHHYRTLIRKVTLGGNAVVFSGTNYKNVKIDTFSRKIVSIRQDTEYKSIFRFNQTQSIEFEYIAPFFDEETALEYSHYLKGYDKTWSAWSKDNKRPYTNLPEGNYTFYVKARNIYGIESMEAAYRFQILPPWYRSIYAYLTYPILLFLFILGIIRLYTNGLRRRNLRLERQVEQRTAEISLKNVELEKQREEISIQAENLKEANEAITIKNKEIQHKSDEITSSINYASRIQIAMLPQMDKIKAAFPHSFFIYQPRDIVSGDFYWFAETPAEPMYAIEPSLTGKPSIFRGFSGNKKIIAAIDCTGHGVPGAFMSMVGDAYMNQIVNSLNITDPGLILKELDFNIRNALHQDETENLDGMDMTMCVVDEQNYTLQFAGAKNPMVYIQNNQLFQISGEKIGIGGFDFDRSKPKHFTTHSIEVDAPTCFYLFSDGFQDQFGGPRGKKFMIKQMKELLLEYHHKPMDEQKIILEKALTDWMEGFEQVDDILLIGVYLNPEEFVSV